MCGIAGFLLRDGDQPDPELLTRMTDTIAHRGPDDSGAFIDGPVALGFRRLSILDLACGHQPMSTPDGRYTIIFNGEIYNHLDVRRELGGNYNTTSDTETILHAWQQWGPDCTKRLAGMFALALWDAREQRLFLARDRCGKKPLYFYRWVGGFAFASEIKALLTHPAVPRDIDTSQIATWVTHRYLPGDETLFKDIECVPTGTWIGVRPDGSMTEPESFWSYPEPCRLAHLTEVEMCAAFQEELTRAVATRMVADVPVGAFLSGGLDSSMICALIRKVTTGRLKTFSVGFDTGFSETPMARLVSDHLGTEHFEIVATSDDMLSVVGKVLMARETPISEPSDLAIYKLAELARREVTVVLSGEGSDEILGGYPKYRAENLLQKFGPIGAAASPLATLFRPGSERRNTMLAALAESDKFERFARWFGAFSSRERKELYGDKKPKGSPTAYGRQRSKGFRSDKAADLMMYLDFREWLPANLLLRGDRMTMAHSLELRCPFLDHRVIEYAVGHMPADFRLRGPNGKYPLMQIAGEYLPEEILARKKWGFKLPVGEWFRGPWKNSLEAVLLTGDSGCREWFDAAHLKQLIEEHQSRARDHSKKLWCLFQLELWRRMFITGELNPGDRIA